MRLRWNMLLVLAVSVAGLSTGCGSGAPRAMPPSDSATADRDPTPSSCPVDAAVCAFATNLEAPLQRGDPWAFIEPGSATEAAPFGVDMGSAIKGLLASGRDRPVVVSIGCPVGEGSRPDCGKEFAVAVSSLASGQTPETPTAGLAVIGFERTPTGARIVGLSGAPEREVALQGGVWQQNVRFTIGGCTGCSVVFVPYRTGAAPAPDLTLGREAKPVEIRAIPFPANFSIVVAATGGPKGHGGAFALIRFSRLSGQLEGRTLWTEEGALITSVVAVGEEGSRELLVAVCRGPSCYLEGGPKEDVVTTFFRSIDGGVTLLSVGLRVGEWSVMGRVGEQVLIGRIDTGNTWLLHPSGDEVLPPAAQLHMEWPFVFKGRPAWLPRSEPAVVGSAAGADTGRYEELLRAPVPTGIRARIEAAPPAYEQNVVLLSTLVQPTGAPFPYSVNHYIAAFKTNGNFTHVVRLGQTTFMSRFAVGFTVTGELHDETPGICPTRANRPYSSLPAFLELDTGIVSVVRDPFACAIPYSIVVNTGTAHYRVTTPGDCLNVRNRPDGEVIACVADGVLLRRSGEPDASPEGRWIHVTTPAGQVGWVAPEFLAR